MKCQIQRDHMNVEKRLWRGRAPEVCTEVRAPAVMIRLPISLRIRQRRPKVTARVLRHARRVGELKGHVLSQFVARFRLNCAKACGNR